MDEDPLEKYAKDLDTDDYDFGDPSPVTIRLCTDEDVERVAEALWNATYLNEWQSAGEIGREHYLLLARMAIRAYWKGRRF